MSSAMAGRGQSSTGSTVESERGCAGVRVGLAARRRANWWRRRSILTTGAWPATALGGSGRRLAAMASYRERGRGKRGVGGSPAHQECVGMLAEDGDGSKATILSAATAAGARGDGGDSRDLRCSGTIVLLRRNHMARRSSWRPRFSVRWPESMARRGDRG